MRANVSLAALVILLACAAALGPSAQTPAPAVAPAPTGFIAGQVIEVPSGRPVPEASVMLPVLAARGGGRGTVVTVVTDAHGRFFFGNLPAGLYRPIASRPGFTVARTGITVIQLADGERLVDARLRLERFASLSGTLRDDAGDPIVGAEVAVLNRTVLNGVATYVFAARVRSDDRGVFRIGGLPAIEYVVCACQFDVIPFDGTLLSTLATQPMNLLALASRALVAGADAVSLDDTLTTYPQTFYPDSLSIARATRIALTPGEEREGVDMTIPRVRATRVSGVVSGARGAVTASAIRLLPADAEANQIPFSLPPMLVQPDGRFDFVRVPPGAYRLSVSLRDTGVPGGSPTGLALAFLGPRGQPPPPGPVPGGPAGGPQPAPLPLLWAEQPITVGNDGASGIVVTLNRGVSVTGRLEFVGAAPQPPPQQFARLEVGMVAAVSDLTFGNFMGGRVAPDATFVVPEIRPGRYSLNVPALPGFPSLKSVVLDGVDVTDRAIAVGDRDLRDVVVTFSDAPIATLMVTTTPSDPRRRMDPNPVALVFPTDRSYWPDVNAARRRFRASQISLQGSAVVTGLPAGEYFVVVMAPEAIVDGFTEALLEQQSRRAERVRLSDGDKATLAVRR